jgi:hypothetical protein
MKHWITSQDDEGYMWAVAYRAHRFELCRGMGEDAIEIVERGSDVHMSVLCDRAEVKSSVGDDALDLTGTASVGE